MYGRVGLRDGWHYGWGEELKVGTHPLLLFPPWIPVRNPSYRLFSIHLSPPPPPPPLSPSFRSHSHHPSPLHLDKHPHIFTCHTHTRCIHHTTIFHDCPQREIKKKKGRKKRRGLYLCGLSFYPSLIIQPFCCCILPCRFLLFFLVAAWYFLSERNKNKRAARSR